MTEELEKKLNELLGLKKQLEEATEQQHKINTSSVLGQYKKETRFLFIRLCVTVTVGWAMVMFGAIIFLQHTDVVYISCPIIIITGLILMLGAKICWLIRQGKLSILREMKQFELRIMEMLKK